MEPQAIFQYLLDHHKLQVKQACLQLGYDQHSFEFSKKSYFRRHRVFCMGQICEKLKHLIFSPKQNRTVSRSNHTFSRFERIHRESKVIQKLQKDKKNYSTRTQSVSPQFGTMNSHRNKPRQILNELEKPEKKTFLREERLLSRLSLNLCVDRRKKTVLRRNFNATEPSDIVVGPRIGSVVNKRAGLQKLKQFQFPIEGKKLKDTIRYSSIGETKKSLVPQICTEIGIQIQFPENESI